MMMVDVDDDGLHVNLVSWLGEISCADTCSSKWTVENGCSHDSSTNFDTDLIIDDI